MCTSHSLVLLQVYDETIREIHVALQISQTQVGIGTASYIFSSITFFVTFSSQTWLCCMNYQDLMGATFLALVQLQSSSICGEEPHRLIELRCSLPCLCQFSTRMLRIDSQDLNYPALVPFYQGKAHHGQWGSSVHQRLLCWVVQATARDKIRQWRPLLGPNPSQGHATLPPPGSSHSPNGVTGARAVGASTILSAHVGN